MKCGHCQKVIRSKNERENYERRYPTFCSYQCQERANLQAALDYLRERRTAESETPSHE